MGTPALPVRVTNSRPSRPRLEGVDVAEERLDQLGVRWDEPGVLTAAVFEPAVLAAGGLVGPGAAGGLVAAGHKSLPQPLSGRVQSSTRRLRASAGRRPVS